MGGWVKRRMKECMGTHRGHTWSPKVIKLMSNLNLITFGLNFKIYLTFLRVLNHVFWLLGRKQAHRAACPFLFQMERSVGASEGTSSRELEGAGAGWWPRWWWKQGVGADEGQSGREGSSSELTLGLGMEQCELVIHISILFQSLSPIQFLQSIE